MENIKKYSILLLFLLTISISYAAIDFTPSGSGTSPTITPSLQEVTDVGASTTNDIETGQITATNSVYTSGTDQATINARFKTTNSGTTGSMSMGKFGGGNNGVGLRFQQEEGTDRLVFRGSSSPGAMVWSQPETGARLLIDIPNRAFEFRDSSFKPMRTGVNLGGTTATTRWNNFYSINAYFTNDVVTQGDTESNTFTLNGTTIDDWSDVNQSINADCPSGEVVQNISSGTLECVALQSETDPVFSASQASNITATDITNLGNLSGTNTGDQDLSGLVPYTGATTDVDLGANDLIVDTDTLFLDSSTGNVGIGTDSPDGKLDVQGGRLLVNNPPLRGLGSDYNIVTQGRVAVLDANSNGLEFRYLADYGGMLAYNRDTRTYLPASIEGSQVQLDVTGDTKLLVDDKGVRIGATSGETNTMDGDDLYVADNVEIAGALALGTNTWDGLANGDINASTIYYDTLQAKSPIVMCSDMNCKVEVPELKEVYYIERDTNYNILSFDKPLPTVVTDKFAELKAKKLTDDARTSCLAQGRFYEFNNNQCTLNVKAQCESDGKSSWTGSKCLENPYLACEQALNTSWNLTANSCQFDAEKQCTQELEWNWNPQTNQCTEPVIPEKTLQQLQRECLQDPATMWNTETNECIELRLYLAEPYTQPTGAHDAYQIGDVITWNNKYYESIINANVWSPSAYPAGWNEI